MVDESLLMLLNEVRGKTLRVLEGLGPSEALWAPPGLQNSCLWHAGHSYVVVEVLTMKALGQPPELPDGWFEMFSWESRPAEVPSEQWPPIDEVITALNAQPKRFQPLFAALSLEQLNEPSDGNPNWSRRFAILHALHDEARHSGEISLLRKLMARTFTASTA